MSQIIEVFLLFLGYAPFLTLGFIGVVLGIIALLVGLPFWCVLSAVFLPFLIMMIWLLIPSKYK